MEKQAFEDILATFTGTMKYTDIQPLSHLKLTDGVSWLLGKSSLISDIATRITYDPKLVKESFLSIKVVVDDNATTTYLIDDGNDNVLFQSDKGNYDLPKNVQFTLFAQNDVLLLSSEY